jgi:hypothetical protein
MDAEGSKWGNQGRWSLSAELVASPVVDDAASSSEPTFVLRASVRRHRRTFGAPEALFARCGCDARASS